VQAAEEEAPAKWEMRKGNNNFEFNCLAARDSVSLATSRKKGSAKADGA
jgi:hypothetical protein